MLNSSAAIYGEKAAFLVKKQGNGSYIPVSYNQFKNDTDAFGTALIDLGLKDKSIAIIGENRYEWCVSYLSVVNGTGLWCPLTRSCPLTRYSACWKEPKYPPLFIPIVRKRRWKRRWKHSADPLSSLIWMPKRIRKILVHVRVNGIRTKTPSGRR